MRVGGGKEANWVSRLGVRPSLYEIDRSRQYELPTTRNYYCCRFHAATLIWQNAQHFQSQVILANLASPLARRYDLIVMGLYKQSAQKNTTIQPLNPHRVVLATRFNKRIPFSVLTPRITLRQQLRLLAISSFDRIDRFHQIVVDFLRDDRVEFIRGVGTDVASHPGCRRQE